MRTATTVEFSRDTQQVVAFVREAETMGLDLCWVAEAWGSDAPSALGYLAARTERILLGSGIIQLGTRSPVAIAQAALTLADLSGGRFLLGLGASGPQVMEGLHGVPFARALTRMRETITVIRRAWSGEKISFQGDAIRIPLDGNSKPMRLSMPANPDIPIYIASMSPRMLELTGQLADGWLGTSFVPEGSDAYFDHLDAGLKSAGRTRADIDVCQGAEVAIFDDEEAVTRHIAGRKLELAFSIGGMGTASTNFYNAAYARQGWADVTEEIRERWQSGDREGATALVTDDMVLATTLIGTADMVKRRLRTWSDVGVDTVRLYPAGDTLDAKLANLAQALDLVAGLDEPAATGD
ncbi:LLM class flavin-dependent oxidoreductase [Nocardia sp. ET3-3]|uniref:LLM class flavin-dependent oxidoreductase n=1 Tax=Nocardia terrae TaxID=2675851 RepID=A0A7K1UTL9_9NOCA|nr:LLM class flavin-dependent oxidoreductase [Nocardia terrae]MVU77703.1 LLM class flavin-dependent oxidoreductase [Nocardia terrae]